MILELQYTFYLFIYISFQKNQAAKDVIILSISDLTLLSKSIVANFKNRFLFIEFHDFLEMDPKDLETPDAISTPKLKEPVDINFKRGKYYLEVFTVCFQFRIMK